MIRKGAIFKKLILHVGSHKTGTSAVQKAADGRRNALLNQGILYPRTGQWHDRSHHHWAFAILDETEGMGKLDTLIANLEQERDETGKDPEIALMSSELLEKIPHEGKLHPTLTSFLGRIAESVECVYFVRRQDMLIESVFKQWVKDNKLRLKCTVQDFISQQAPRLVYLDTAKKWEGLQNVSKMHLHTNALLTDPVRVFFNICGMELEDITNQETTLIVNPTLDGRKLEFKYFLNFLDISEADDRKLLRCINQIDSPHEAVSLFSENDRAAIIEEFKPGNDILSKHYGAELFNDDFPKRDRMFCSLSGKNLEGMLQHLNEVDPRLTWVVYDKIRRLVQSH